MADNVLGLLFEISADPSKAEAALGGLQRQVAALPTTAVPALEKVGQAARGAGVAAQEGLKGADASLLTSRESARLLSQELGLTLPRAITSGMSRIPDLQSALLGLGAVAVGIFAVKEAGKFLGSMADAIRESVVATGAFEDLGKAAEAAFKGAREEAVKAYTDFKSIAAGAFRIDEIHAQTEVLTKYVQAFAMLKDKAAGDLRLLGIINIEALRTINDAAHHGITSLKEAEQKLAEASQWNLTPGKDSARLRISKPKTMKRPQKKLRVRRMRGQKSKRRHTNISLASIIKTSPQ